MKRTPCSSWVKVGLALALAALVAGRVEAQDDGVFSIDADVDRVGDLVGYLCVDEAILYVVAEHEQQVLDSLGAEPDADGHFGFDRNVGGVRSRVGFTIQQVDSPARFAATSDDPVLVCAQGDYKTYKNAKCQFQDHWTSVPCGPYINNQSATVDYRPRHKCKSGTQYCTEVNQVWWIRNVYDDAACRVLLQIDTGKDFMCSP